MNKPDRQLTAHPPWKGQNTYAVHGFQVELGSAVPGTRPAYVSSYVFVGTVSLAADGSVSFNSLSSVGNQLNFGAPPTVFPFQRSENPGPSTWSYANGTVTIAGGAPPLSVSAGGRVLVGASANPADGTDVLLALTRLQ
jgi:hypothetical protein